MPHIPLSHSTSIQDTILYVITPLPLPPSFLPSLHGEYSLSAADLRSSWFSRGKTANSLLPFNLAFSLFRYTVVYPSLLSTFSLILLPIGRFSVRVGTRLSSGRASGRSSPFKVNNSDSCPVHSLSYNSLYAFYGVHCRS